MTSGVNPQDLNRPLSAGDIISVSLRLYTSHFKTYLGVALQAILWLVPITVLDALSSLAEANGNLGLLALLRVAWLVTAIFCFAEYLASSMAIARLAFGQLVNQPEAPGEAKRFTRTRKWNFLGIAILMGLIFVGVFLVFVIPLGLLIAAGIGLSLGASGSAASLSQALSNGSTGAIAVGIGLLTILLLLGFFVFFMWFSARFSIGFMPAAIESESGTIRSLKRGWQLTKRHGWRIVLVFLVLFLLSLPLLIAYYIVFGIIFAIFLSSSGITSLQPTDLSRLSPALIGFSLVTSLLGLAVSTFILPLQQAIASVIYFDLRNRQEGMGLRLGDAHREN